MKPANHFRPLQTPRWLQFFATLLVLVATSPLLEAGSLAKLTIQPEKGDRLGFFQLSWESTPDFVYRLQSTTDLGNNVNWLFGDAVVADGTNTTLEIKGRSIPENSVEFFRLVAQPEIFSLEPAWVDSSDTDRKSVV